MFFRRFVRHFRRQNWIAITLEFLVVVCGVVLGVQIDRWNIDRARDIEFDLAMGRLQTETQENIAALRTMYTELESIIPDISAGIDALRRCRGNEDDIEAVLKAVDHTLGTRDVELAHAALGYSHAIRPAFVTLIRTGPIAHHQVCAFFGHLSKGSLSFSGNPFRDKSLGLTSDFLRGDKSGPPGLYLGRCDI